MHFTTIILNLINGLSGKSHLLDKFMMYSSMYGPYVLMLITILLYVKGVFTKKEDIRLITVHTVIKTGLAIIVSQVISTVMPLSRPFIKYPEETNLVYYHKGGAGFPSDHSTGCAGIAFGLKEYTSVLNNVYMFIAVLVGFSRVYVGHHFPLDVIGGFVLAYITGKVYNKYLRDFISKIYLIVEKYTPILRKLV